MNEDFLTVQVNQSFTEKIYAYGIQATAGLPALLWLPVSRAADSGWLRAAENQHASVRRAQHDDGGTTRLLLDVALEKAGKPTGAPRGRRHCARYRPKTPLDVTGTGQRRAGLTSRDHHPGLSR